MSDDERRALAAPLERLREIHEEISDMHAGVAVLHLEATIAALESQLRRMGRKAA